MKSKIITTLLLFFSSYIFSQIFNGSIHYKVKVGSDELFESMSKEDKANYIADIENEKYILEFDTNQSIFKYEGGISINGYNKIKKIYYKEKDSLFSLRPENDPDFVNIIIIENKNTKWILHNETKIIGGYTCYKATSEFVRNDGSSGIFKFPIVAWYSPKIAIPFGPLGYGDLPGLIFELQERNVLYGVEKINLNLKGLQLIQKPNTGSRISKEDLDKKISEIFKTK